MRNNLANFLHAVMNVVIHVEYYIFSRFVSIVIFESTLSMLMVANIICHKYDVEVNVM